MSSIDAQPRHLTGAHITPHLAELAPPYHPVRDHSGERSEHIAELAPEPLAMLRHLGNQIPERAASGSLGLPRLRDEGEKASQPLQWTEILVEERALDG